MKSHIFIMGARGYTRNYGGWETFTYNLIKHWNVKDDQFYVTEVIHRKKDEAIITHGDVICPQVYAPQIGGATMVYFSIRALNKSLRYVRDHQLKNVIFVILGLRIGHVFALLNRKIKQLGIKVIINPDGFEWERAKWPWFVKRYFLLSEAMMFQYSDAITCDSKTIQNYVNQKYPAFCNRTHFIAYGAEMVSDTSNGALQDFYKKHKISSNEYYLIVGRFVPENNLELIIKEYMKSTTTKDLIIITNKQHNKFYKRLKKATSFEQDARIKFAGVIYDKKLLASIRYGAYGYIHGHSVGGTNPSLLESLAFTKLNLLYDVPFNREVGQESVYYFDCEDNPLHQLIKQADTFSEELINEKGRLCKKRIRESYSWEFVVDAYKKVFDGLMGKNDL